MAGGAALPWTWFLVRDLGWLAEPFAVAFPLLVLVALVVLGIFAYGTRRPGPLVVAASVLALGAVVVLAPRAPEPTPAPRDPVRILSANVYELNPQPKAAAAALAATDADVLVAVEVPQGFGELLASADAVRPYAVAARGMIVRSRFPVSLLDISGSLSRDRVLRALVRGPSGPFVLYAVHALNPSHESTFDRQLGFVERLQRAATRETEPVVIAGDFNMSDRQLGYRRITSSFRDAMRTDWAADTYDHALWRSLLLRIDYVFIDPSWCAAGAHDVDIPGSDHEGVATTIGPCPG